MGRPINWLASTVGKRNYIAHYLRESSPTNSSVIGTGNDYYTPGFAACDRSYVVPPIDDPRYGEAVIDLCQRENIDALLTLSDVDVRVLSRIRSQLVELGVTCFIPSNEVAERFANKFLAYDYLMTLGVKTPLTTTDLVYAIEKIGFPLVIKPAYGSASSGFSVFDEPDAAERHWSTISQPIAQEFVEGRLINVETCSSATGEILAVSAWERQSSARGETLLATTIEHPRALELAIEIATDSSISGPTDMDIIERDGELFLLEVNTRFGGGYPVSHLAAADFTGAMVLSLEGRKPKILDAYRRGVTMMKEIRPFIYEVSAVQKA